MEPEPIEELAWYAHAAWSGWMKYLFDNSQRLGSGTVLIPAKLVERWERQMNTDYNDLPEEEKESDRAEGLKMMEIVREFRKEEQESKR